MRRATRAAREHATLLQQEVVERARAEAATLAQQRHYARLVRNLPDIVFHLDANLRYLFISPVVERFSGQPAASFAGKTSREIGLAPLACEGF